MLRDPIPYEPDAIAATLLAEEPRVLLFGETGVGKSTLACALARALARSGSTCLCLGADPGSPAFGIPGAVGLGEWRGDGWQLLRFEALCTLDAGRFRLPLVGAVRRLAAGLPGATLLLDAPGVVRGVAAAELLRGLVEAAAIDAVLLLCREGNRTRLAGELQTLSCEVWPVAAAAAAREPGKRQRAARRRRLWEAYLAGAAEREISLAGMAVTGTPPGTPAEWPGLQVGLLAGQQTVAMGEVVARRGDSLRVRMPPTSRPADQLLIRNAGRNERGELASRQPFASRYFQFVPPPDVGADGALLQATGPRPVAHIGSAACLLVNGLFGDPLLHLRLREQGRSLLFDLGEGGRLPAKIAHQVSDVFVSHCHFDHLSGFLWLLRSRIGDYSPCRIYGPPGLAAHLDHLISGILWDRVDDQGPRFEVAELCGTELHWWSLQAGRGRVPAGDREEAKDGILRQEPLFTVRAALLDHGTPVLAYAFEHAPVLRVRKERLAACPWEPGPWLHELKARIAAGEHHAMIRLPDGSEAAAGPLADELIETVPGQRLVYATDLADTPGNRERLEALARGAQVLFCEAAFVERDRDRARRSGHLTARACGEIAAAAGVRALVPFHFSRRYEKDPGPLYAEVRAVCPQAVLAE